MGVYIKGMEMPKACVYRENGHLITCPLYDIDGYCGALNTEASHKENGKLSGCPLVPVPPHGRLIDADALTEITDGIWDCNDLYFQPNDKICDPDDCKGCKWRETMDCFQRMVKHAPTIIPAEEG